MKSQIEGGARDLGRRLYQNSNFRALRILITTLGGRSLRDENNIHGILVSAVSRLIALLKGTPRNFCGERMPVGSAEGTASGCSGSVHVANALTLRVQPLKLLTIEPTGEAAPGQRIILTGRVIDEKETAVSSGLPMVLCLTGPTRGPVKM